MNYISIGNSILSRINAEISKYSPDKAYGCYLIEYPNNNGKPRLIWLIRCQELQEGRYHNGEGTAFSQTSPIYNAIAEANNEPTKSLIYKLKNGSEIKAILHATSKYRINENRRDAYQGYIQFLNQDKLHFENSLREVLESFKEKISLNENDVKDSQALPIDVEFIDNLEPFNLNLIIEGLNEKEKLEETRRTSGITLNEQFMLDSKQNIIKRTNIHSGPIIINGGPGTGKTTTLIHRIQYILDPNIYKFEKTKIKNSEIEKLSSHRNTSWIFYAPNRLLKLYLMNAMTAGGLNANPDTTVRTWEEVRTKLRISLGIFIPGSSNSPFLNEENSGKKLWKMDAVKLHDLRKYLLRQLVDIAYEKIKIEEVDLIGCSSVFKAEIKNLKNNISDLRSKNDIRLVLNKIMSIKANHEKIENLVNTSINKPIEVFVNFLSIKDVKKININELLQKLDSSDSNEFKKLFPDEYGKIKDYKIFHNYLKSLNFSPEYLLIDNINNAYKRLREREIHKISFLENETKQIIDNIVNRSPYNKKLSVDEQDFLIDFYLYLIRAIQKYLPPVFDNSNHNSIIMFKENVKAIVSVDEATDFTVTQLSCIFQLSDNRFNNSVNLSGDLMQQIEDTGFSKWEDLIGLIPNLQIYNLDKSYRQTGKLIDLARNLYKNRYGYFPEFDKVAPDPIPSPDPVYIIEGDFNNRINWISERIIEVYTFYNGAIPNIAIFVQQNENKVADALNACSSLRDYGLSAEACIGEGNLGDAQRIRVLNLKLIKGMEFDCVFFMDIDQYESNDIELLDKYVYVGISRARHFLAITCVNRYPECLNSIKELMVESGKWI